MSKLLVITGTQRSGTSFMAKFFKECGFDLGTEFWDERVNGGLESPDVCDFYKSIVGDPEFPFHGYWPRIERDEFVRLASLHKEFDVIKFSYLLSNPLFLNRWLDIRRDCDDTFLIMKRPLEDVIKSRKTKPEFDEEDSEIIPRTLRELKGNWSKCMSTITAEDINYFFVPFPNPDAEETVGKIRQWIELPDNAEDIYTNLFDPNKVQFK